MSAGLILESVMSDNDNIAVAEIHVMMDEDGDYEVGKDEDEVEERFENEIGGTRARQRYVLSVGLRKSRAIHASATLPEGEDGKYELQLTQSS
jgi:hypothetical protein